MKSFSKIVLAFAVMAFISNAGVPAHAKLLYEQTNGGNPVAGNNPFSYSVIAEDFSLKTGASLSDLAFAVWTVDGDTVSPTGAQVFIYQDVAGEVGSELYSGTFAVSDLGSVSHAYGYDIRNYGVSLPNWSLDAGKYYLGLTVAPIQWNYHWDLPTFGGIGDSSYQSSSGASDTFSPYPFEHSFSLYDSSAAVPEPSSFALLGLGGIGMAARAYRRRRMAAV